MSSRSVARTVAMAVAATLALAACGIPSDAGPRTITTGEQPFDLAPTREPVVADDPNLNGPRVYFLLQQTDERLEPVGRKVAAESSELLNALMQGPTDEELGRGVNTAIPTGTRLLSASLDRFSGTLQVDVSEEFITQQAPAVGKAVAQVVFTAGGAPGVQRVVLTAAGKAYPWPSGDRTFPEGEAMSRLDFPDLDPTQYPELTPPPPTIAPTTTPGAGEPN